jgi:Protein of unknown function (DUF3102)
MAQLERLDTLAEQINEEHHKVEAAMGSALQHARRAGKLLIEAKERTHHGEWLPWLKANFEGSERTAQMYMRVHSRWPEIEANTKSVSDLTLTGALREIGPPQEAAITRERFEGPLRWAGVEAGEESTEAREPGVIEQMQKSPRGREVMAEINREFDAEGAYLRVRSKIHDLALLMRHVVPEEAASREFAHHAADIARDAVMDRRPLRPIHQVEYAEAVRDWLGEYIQRLEDAEARIHERGEGE